MFSGHQDKLFQDFRIKTQRKNFLSEQHCSGLIDCDTVSFHGKLNVFVELTPSASVCDLAENVEKL